MLCKTKRHNCSTLGIRVSEALFFITMTVLLFASNNASERLHVDSLRRETSATDRKVTNQDHESSPQHGATSAALPLGSVAGCVQPTQPDRGCPRLLEMKRDDQAGLGHQVTEILIAFRLGSRLGLTPIIRPFDRIESAHGEDYTSMNDLVGLKSISNKEVLEEYLNSSARYAMSVPSKSEVLKLVNVTVLLVLMVAISYMFGISPSATETALGITSFTSCAMKPNTLILPRLTVSLYS
jgi:hypothetical protein